MIAGQGQSVITKSSGRILRWNGKEWFVIDYGNTRSIYWMWAVFGTSSDNMWTIGGINGEENSSILQLEGTNWRPIFDTPQKYAYELWASAPNDVWIVGTPGYLARWDGTKLQEYDGGTKENINGVYGSAKNDVWAVGDHGVIIHWDGDKWSAANNTSKEILSSVWAASKNAAWAVGRRGIILRWNGVEWKVVRGGTGVDLYDVWGSGENDVWAVGAEGTILHWNGVDWSLTQSGTTAGLTGVSGSGANDVWVVGYNSQGSIVLHLRK